MAEVTINYKDAAIATMDASGTKTLQTQGKYCEDDIEVVYARPSAPSGTKQISITQNGTTVENVAAYANAEITVNVQVGGGISADDIAGHTISGNISISVASILEYAFYGQQISGITAPNLTTVCAFSLAYCRSLGTVKFPEVTTIENAAFAYAGGTSMNNTNCILVFPKLSSMSGRANFDRGRFIAIDIGPDLAALAADAFYHNSSQQTVGTLILRRTADIVTAPAIGAIRGLRDVYVPNALKESYEAAANWSTQVSNGYITFHAIEGSIYENVYADGTTIT